MTDRLHAAKLEVRTGLGRTGVVGVLRSDRPGRTIAWRADIDALLLTARGRSGKLPACPPLGVCGPGSGPTPRCRRVYLEWPVCHRLRSRSGIDSRG